MEAAQGWRESGMMGRIKAIGGLGTPQAWGGRNRCREEGHYTVLNTGGGNKQVESGAVLNTVPSCCIG